MNQFEWKLTENLCEIARRMDHTGYMSGSDSNLPTILRPNEMMFTPFWFCEDLINSERALH